MKTVLAKVENIGRNPPTLPEGSEEGFEVSDGVSEGMLVSLGPALSVGAAESEGNAVSVGAAESEGNAVSVGVAASVVGDAVSVAGAAGEVESDEALGSSNGDASLR
ncbi:MAG: hypothetical protein ABIO06_09290 [Pseudolysinimonas sp.]